MDSFMRLKSWESPRSGRRRNDKSKQASARVRQLKKQTKLLRKRLKSSDDKGSAQTPGIIPGVLFWVDFEDRSHLSQEVRSRYFRGSWQNWVTLVLLMVVVACEAIVSFVETGERRSFTTTLKRQSCYSWLCFCGC
jgi:hypothetical protein